jgi:hypothetical protein
MDAGDCGSCFAAEQSTFCSHGIIVPACLHAGAHGPHNRDKKANKKTDKYSSWAVCSNCFGYNLFYLSKVCVVVPFFFRAFCFDILSFVKESAHFGYLLWRMLCIFFLIAAMCRFCGVKMYYIDFCFELFGKMSG